MVPMHLNTKRCYASLLPRTNPAPSTKELGGLSQNISYIKIRIIIAFQLHIVACVINIILSFFNIITLLFHIFIY